MTYIMHIYVKVYFNQQLHHFNLDSQSWLTHKPELHEVFTAALRLFARSIIFILVPFIMVGKSQACRTPHLCLLHKLCQETLAPSRATSSVKGTVLEGKLRPFVDCEYKATAAVEKARLTLAEWGLGEWSICWQMCTNKKKILRKINLFGYLAVLMILIIWLCVFT